MDFFIDTANLQKIKTASEWGILDGVTTNPSLISKEGVRNFHDHIKKICEIVKGPVSAEVISLNFDGMIKEAKEIAQIAENVVVKIPMTQDGMKAVSFLSKEGIKTNVTLVFSSVQALIAAKAGASYISPFLGRIDDIAGESMDLLEEIIQIFYNYSFETKIIAASIRHPRHVAEAAALGAHIATIPYETLEKLFYHPLTDIGIERFLNDWKKIQ